MNTEIKLQEKILEILTSYFCVLKLLSKDLNDLKTRVKELEEK